MELPKSMQAYNDAEADAEADAEPSSQDDSGSSRPWRSRWAVWLLVAAVLGVAALAISQSIAQSIEHQSERLEGLAELRAAQVGGWLLDRAQVARQLRRGAVQAELIGQAQRPDGQEARAELLARLVAYRGANGWDEVVLLRTDGSLLLHEGEVAPVLEDEVTALARRSAASGDLMRTELYASGSLDTPLRLDFVVPVGGPTGVLVVLRANPPDGLLPLLAPAPGQAPSVETLLLRLDGTRLTLLSPLRDDAAAAGSLSWTLSLAPELLLKVFGNEQSPGQAVEGLDWRGTPAYGALRAVPSTDWHLLAKVDRHDMVWQALRSAAWIAAAACVALGLTAYGVHLFRQQQALQRERVARSQERERYRIQALLQGIADSSPDAIYAKDVQGRFLFYNPAAAAVMDRTLVQMLGRDASAYLTGEELQAVQAHDAQVLHEQRLLAFEEVLTSPRGPRTFEAIKGPLRNELGHVVGLFGISRDVTDARLLDAELRQHRDHLEERVEERTRALAESEARLRETNEQLRRTRDLALQASRAKSAFLANMSHEIRTPMNAILGLTHLLDHDLQDPVQRARLGKVSTAARHLMKVLNDVLDLSKIESGRLSLEQTDFSLRGLLGQLQDLMAEPAAARGLQLRIDTDSLPDALHGDPTRLLQVLLNLVGNALKFTEHGQVRLQGQVVGEDDAGLQLHFEVSDTGIGIPAEQLAHLFQAFQQADNSTTRRFGGSGLGLVISRHLARLMGGDLTAQSVPGQGSRFTFTARLARARAQPAEATPDGLRRIRSPQEQALHLHHRGQAVLLAEDNPINQEVARALLEAVGLQVDIVEDGHQAVVAARRRPYALMLMDVQMPGLDGLAATRQIRALPGHARTPILAMTANAFEDDRNACLAAGMDDHVAKPVDPPQFYARLLQWLPEARPPAQATEAAEASGGAEVANVAKMAQVAQVVDGADAAEVAAAVEAPGTANAA